VIAAHLDETDRRIDAGSRLRARLAHLLESIATSSYPNPGDLLEVLEAMSLLDQNVQRGISILVYADLEAAHDYLCRAFELSPGEMHRDGDRVVVHVQLRAGHGEVWLHQESPKFELASPRSLGGASAMVAVIVDDVVPITDTPSARAPSSCTNRSTNHTVANGALATPKAPCGHFSNGWAEPRSSTYPGRSDHPDRDGARPEPHRAG
jgi:hypothetical protein